MNAIEDPPITNVLVPGRSHDIVDGELVLSASSVARVEAAAAYYHRNDAPFAELGGVILFEGGWAESAGGMPKPSVELREGRLMRMLGIELGIPKDLTKEGIKSTSTMSNMLQARRHFLGATSLLVVTQRSQAERFMYCGKKALPGTEITILEAEGEEDLDIIAQEQRLLQQSRLIYGWAHGPVLLKFADRLVTRTSQLVGHQSAAKYATAAQH